MGESTNNAVRYSYGRATPSDAQVAYKLAMAHPKRVGESVRWYEDEKGEVRWGWICRECRCSQTGYPTREVARHMFDRHGQGCLGYEPEWLRRQREEYGKKLDQERRARTPSYRSRSSTIRTMAWAEQSERDRRTMGGDDAA